MKLNSKGQVTIPAELRQKYDFREGDEVEVVENEGVLCIRHHRGAATRGERIAARLRGSATARETEGMTTEQLMELLRGE